jgi:hypothetical protein
MKPVYLKGYILLITLTQAFSGTYSSLWWCARDTCSQSTGMLEPQAPCCSMPDPLAHKEVPSRDVKGMFLTTGNSLPLLSSQLPSAGCCLWLPKVVCHKYWLQRNPLYSLTPERLYICHLWPQVSCNHQLPVVVNQNY